MIPLEFKYPEDQYLLIGKVGKPHGLRGEIKLICFSQQPENIHDYDQVVLIDMKGRISAPFKILKCRAQGKSAIVAFDGITTREQAEDVGDAGVLVAKEKLPPIAEDEYYWHQFTNRTLVDTRGNHIGTVESLFNNGAQDVLVVKAGDEEILIPVTKSIVVGEKSGDIVIDPPPGLLELNTDSNK